MSDFGRRAALTLGVPLLVYAPICTSAALASSADSATGQKHGNASPAVDRSHKHAGEARLISLAPSNTELLCTIGAKSEIIGVCSFCDYPQDVSGINKVGTFVSANMERLCRLKPDYVLLVSGQEMLAAQLAHNHFKTLILDNSHLANIGKNLKKLGEISGKAKEADNAAKNFDLALQNLGDILPRKDQRDATEKQKAPSVFYCVWPQPLMTAGRDSFLNEVITACGGINIAGDVPASYPRYSMEQLILKNPDVIILPYEARGQSFLTRAPWTMLKAVKEKRLYYLPDQKHDTLSRPTIRVLSGIAWLATILHPERRDAIAAWQKSNCYEQAVGANH
ncbi:MAG: ABC transporter substrate-binding protein [Cyanobacteria bacterium SZAS LIN-2]|nr:ABC transporter substrate-binding protein [Cyanobacteria bacterium SZAS LIN-2]